MKYHIKKITILIIILLLASIGYISYIKMKPASTASITQEATTTVDTMLDDPACDVKKYNEYYEAGFGIVQEFEGTIKKDMPIKALLSCDHTKLTISGSVNQEIILPDEDIEKELVDYSNAVELNGDFNFDGYNDISTMYNHGAGSMAMYNSYYFLYDPLQNKYVYNKMLSDMGNLWVKSTTTKTLHQQFGLGADLSYQETVYVWKDDDLVKISDKVEKYNDNQ